MIYLASDHRGFALKEKIKQWLAEWGMAFEDMGAFEYNEGDDYPDFIHPAAQKVSVNPRENRAIILGASGEGEAMVANRYPGIRAIVFYGGPEETITTARVHNDANVLALGAAPGINIAESKPIDDELAKRVVELFLQTPFSADERHVRRIQKIDQLA